MITGIVMASGFSARFGSNKLISPFRGKMLFSYIIESAKSSNLNEILVVTRYPNIIDYCKNENIKYIYNDNPELGQSNSLVLGVLGCPASSNYMFLTADQPFLNAETINVLIDKFITKNSEIIVPTCKGVPKSPTIFSNKLRPYIIELTGDSGGRQIIKSMPEKVLYVPFEDELVFEDIDTLHDLESLE